MIRFAAETLDKMWFGFLIAAFGAFLISFYTASSWYILGLQSIGITVVYLVSLWFFGFNLYEKQLVSIPLKKVVNKLKKNQE
jgi:uncharacterized membrane protein